MNTLSKLSAATLFMTGAVRGQDILEGAGIFAKDTFYNKALKETQNVLGENRWNFVYKDQGTDATMRSYKSIEVTTGKEYVAEKDETGKEVKDENGDKVIKPVEIGYLQMVKYGLYEDIKKEPEAKRMLEEGEAPVVKEDVGNPTVENVANPKVDDTPKETNPETPKSDTPKNEVVVKDDKEKQEKPVDDNKKPAGEKKDSKEEHLAKAHAHREIRYNDGIYYSFDTYRKQLEYDYNKQIKEVEEYNKKQKEKGSHLIMQENVPVPIETYKQPQHVHFEVSTILPEGSPNDEMPGGYETCNVRLTSIVKNPDDYEGLNTINVTRVSDVFFYRMGYFDYQKLNMGNMIQKYKDQEWYSVDILIDWGNEKSSKTDSNGKAEDNKAASGKQRVSIFINGVYNGTDNFFSGETIGSSTTAINRIESANALLLYGLSPGGISRFRNVQVCIERCEGFESLDFQGANIYKVSMVTLALFVSMLYLDF